jgi:hypothetical protein
LLGIGPCRRKENDMHPWITTATLALALATALPAHAADVGVSIGISQPGVYGRIDIGRFPQPVVVMPQPVIITQPAVAVRPQPAYLWVPPGHRKNWRKHCHRYDACGVPVYFVEDRWYEQHVMEGRPHGKGKGKEKAKHKD